MIDLDAFDRKILALLETDARRTGEQLSEAVGLSPAACLRRLQRLRKTGAIEREVAILSPDVRPRGTTIIVRLQIEGHNPGRMEEISRRIGRDDRVERMFSVTGVDDIVVIMTCPSMADFADFCALHFDGPPVVGYETLVVLKEYPKGA